MNKKIYYILDFIRYEWYYMDNGAQFA